MRNDILKGGTYDGCAVIAEDDLFEFISIFLNLL